MRTKAVLLSAVALGCAAGLLVVAGTSTVQGQGQAGAGFAAVPGEKGGLDITGPYDVVPNWPKPMSASLPGHEMWTWGAVQGVFAESPDRVYMLQRGELPNIQRPQPKPFPEVGPSVSFPTGQVPWRNASQGQVASPPGAGGP